MPRVKKTTDPYTSLLQNLKAVVRGDCLKIIRIFKGQQRKKITDAYLQNALEVSKSTCRRRLKTLKDLGILGSITTTKKTPDGFRSTRLLILLKIKPDIGSQNDQETRGSLDPVMNNKTKVGWRLTPASAADYWANRVTVPIKALIWQLCQLGMDKSSIPSLVANTTHLVKNNRSDVLESIWWDFADAEQGSIKNPIGWFITEIKNRV
jgi:hypothetical protein